MVYTLLSMKITQRKSPIPLVALSILAASDGHAQLPNKLNQTHNAWKMMDYCKRQAWKEFPDYTPEGSAKRDQAVKNCLNSAHLPPVVPPGPPGASPKSGADPR